jgi:hypothetical protein
MPKFCYLAMQLAFAVMLLQACSKNSADGGSTASTGSVAISTTPLPNTVDKTDTLRVMAYNVLYYGDGCQGSTATLNGYFKTIIQYTQPDILSCEKMEAYPNIAGAFGNLAEDMLNNALNVVSPGKYAYSASGNSLGASNMSTLFYNKQKLSLVYCKTIVSNVTEFNLTTTATPT